MILLPDQMFAFLGSSMEETLGERNRGLQDNIKKSCVVSLLSFVTVIEHERGEHDRGLEFTANTFMTTRMTTKGSLKVKAKHG
jgi:hypothetical protein